MKKLVLLWRRLFRRQKSTNQPVSWSMACWLASAHQYQGIEDDIRSDPMMCEPDVKQKRTAHITRIIDARTQPLFRVDGDAPTEAVDWCWPYADDTIADSIDQYATQKMELVEIMR